MRVAELAKMAAQRGMLRHLSRKGYVVKSAAELQVLTRGIAPLALGAMTASSLADNARRMDAVEAALTAAGHQKLSSGWGALTEPFIKGLGKGVADAGLSLMKDVAAKAISAAGFGANAAREAILTQLKREDPLLMQHNDKELMEAYHTMVRFAPTLSTDKNAVRSFLRQAVMSGTGPDYASIKLLADTEHAVTGGKKA